MKKPNYHVYTLVTIVSIAILLLIIQIVFVTTTLSRHTLTSEPIFCAQDVRECPDGSFVSRVAPRCDFILCSQDKLAFWKTYIYPVAMVMEKDWVKSAADTGKVEFTFGAMLVKETIIEDPSAEYAELASSNVFTIFRANTAVQISEMQINEMVSDELSYTPVAVGGNNVYFYGIGGGIGGYSNGALVEFNIITKQAKKVVADALGGSLVSPDKRYLATMVINVGTANQFALAVTDTVNGQSINYTTNWVCSQATNVHYDCFNVVFKVADNFYVAPIGYDGEDGNIYQLTNGNVVRVDLKPDIMQGAVFFR